MTDQPKSPEKDKKNTKEGPEKPKKEPPKEIGGRGGLDPVRYGDWEVGGKCVDF